MPLLGLHTNWQTGSYAGDRVYVLGVQENDKLFFGRSVGPNVRPHFDGNNSIALGYGLDLLVNNDAKIDQYLIAAGFGGFVLSATDKATLANARAYRTVALKQHLSGTGAILQGFAQSLTLDLQTEANARNLLNVIADDKQNQMVQDLSAGGMSAADLVTFIGTKEFLALLSMSFNGVPPVVRSVSGQYIRNTQMLDAILNIAS